jgi:hypothetical protein
MSNWNTIINAVRRNEWHLIDEFVLISHDDANYAAEVLAHEVAQRLIRGAANYMHVTVEWLLRQPYINRERFAEWVVLDSLKKTDALHLQTFRQVRPHCRSARLQEIARHLAACDEQHARAEAARQAVATFSNVLR